MGCLRCVPFLLCAVASAQVTTLNASGGPSASETNNPVSLVLERKQVQTLADGTHISTTVHEYFYRDTLGRTRRETEFPQIRGFGPSVHNITVNDPVASMTLFWVTGQPASQVHEYTRGVITSRPQTSRPAPISRGNGVASHVVLPSQVGSAEMRPEIKHEDLGTQYVQGAACHTTRNTTTFPVGFLGNDRPITTMQESCASAEFRQPLQETEEDPRSGTRTTTLQSITRREPDASLFQPPAGYTERVQQQLP